VGAESRVIAGIIGLKPHRISYVSCDPATLARDLKKLIAGGYRLDSLAAFDMFPQTHHVETVVHLVAA
jgi:23S rRNA (uracil1939-C5)-methyltransferase